MILSEKSSGLINFWNLGPLIVANRWFFERFCVGSRYPCWMSCKTHGLLAKVVATLVSDSSLSLSPIIKALCTVNIKLSNEYAYRYWQHFFRKLSGLSFERWEWSLYGWGRQDRPWFFSVYILDPSSMPSSKNSFDRPTLQTLWLWNLHRTLQQSTSKNQVN